MKIKQKLPYIVIISFVIYHLTLWIIQRFYTNIDPLTELDRLKTFYTLMTVTIIFFSSIFYVLMIVFFRKQKVVFLFSIGSLITIIIYSVFLVIRGYLYSQEVILQQISQHHVSFFGLLQLGDFTNSQTVFLARLGGNGALFLFIVFLYVFVAILKDEYPKIIFVSLMGFLLYNYLFLNFTSYFASAGIYEAKYGLTGYVEFGWIYLGFGVLLTLFQVITIKALLVKEVKDIKKAKELQEMLSKYNIRRPFLD